MTLIITHENPAEYAPSVFYNHCGLMPWSHRSASSLSGIEVVEMLQYCEAEGQRVGWNDALQGRVGSGEEGPFHPEFLGGYPKSAWETSYWSGVQKNDARTLEAIEDEIRELLGKAETSHWLREALTAALKRDCVDATNDAVYLLDLLSRRLDAITMAHSDTDESHESADCWP